MKKALLIIDYTNDFIADNGSLTCGKPAQALEDYLIERKINDLWLTGVCTDICVLHTAMTAYNLNYNLTIPSRGVTTFTEHGQEWALDHFKNSLGAKVIE